MRTDSLPPKVVGVVLIILCITVLVLIVGQSWFVSKRWGGSIAESQSKLVYAWLNGEWSRSENDASTFIKMLNEDGSLVNRRNVCAWIEDDVVLGLNKGCKGSQQVSDVIWQSPGGEATVRFRYSWNGWQATGELLMVGVLLVLPLAAIALLLLHRYLMRQLGGLDELQKAADVIRSGDIVNRVVISKSATGIDGIVQAINHLLGCIVDLKDRSARKKGNCDSSKSVSELEVLGQQMFHEVLSPTRYVHSCGLQLKNALEKNLPVDEKLVDRILETCCKMEGMSKAILALGKIRKNSINVRMVDITALAKTVVNIARNSGIKTAKIVNIVVQDGMCAECDAQYMELVFMNLIKNALIYSANSEVSEIRIGVCNGTNKIFYVQDNGTGFEKEYASIIFAPFKRLRSEKEGYGIGLSTCKRIIDVHGGKIWADGVPGMGAVFYFCLEQCEEVYPIEIVPPDSEICMLPVVSANAASY
jgi:signal transduction histidine kinase